MKYKKDIDYNSCDMKLLERFFTYAKGVFICAVFAVLFYKSIIAFFLLLPFSYFYVSLKKKQKIKERKQKLALEFLEGMKSIAGALNAGYSAENSFEEAYRDLSLIYTRDADIMREFYSIIHKIQMNCTVEHALEDFAMRSDVEEIMDFAEVFATAKRTGGDMIKIIKNTCKVIEGKLEMQREIDISIAGKRYEANIMNLVPLGIIAYMWFFSSDFMKPMYHNITGIMIMTIALLVYLIAYFLSQKIVNFE